MKDTHTYGKKMARSGRTKVIYKGTFISERSLLMQSFIMCLMLVFFLAIWVFLLKWQAFLNMQRFKLETTGVELLPSFCAWLFCHQNLKIFIEIHWIYIKNQHIWTGYLSSLLLYALWKQFRYGHTFDYFFRKMSWNSSLGKPMQSPRNNSTPVVSN